MTNTEVALRVGQSVWTVAELRSLPDQAILLNDSEEPWTVVELLNSWEDKDTRLLPMTLLYLPRSYQGPVDGPQFDADGTESAGGQAVAGAGTPAQEGYQQMMRQKAMAAHPAGKGRTV